VKVTEPDWLRARLEAVRRETGIPSIAASVIVQGSRVAAGAVGVRRVGDPQPAMATDPYHLGSVAKTMTGTLIGRLVDRGILRWDMTMEQLFPKLPMNRAYENLTLLHMLSHTAGLPYQPLTSETLTDSRSTTLPEKRVEYVKAALMDAPEAPPGTRVIYSGGGVIAASAAERKAGIDYEKLMEQELFRPLGMTSARFGAARGKDGVIPSAHNAQGDGYAQREPGSEAEAAQSRSPVGRNIFCNVIDTARYLGTYPDCEKGRPTYLSADTLNRLKQPYSNDSYAPG